MIQLSATQETIGDVQNGEVVKALIVDDSTLDCLILKKILMKSGYDVYIAEDGHSAIKVYKECLPDIVFMDLYLPDTMGYDVTKSIKDISSGAYIPVIFVTRATNDAVLEQCLESGGDDFIIKPIKESLLKAKAKTLLRTKKLHDQLMRDKEEITAYSEAQTKDMQDANEIIDNIRKPHFYNPGNIKYLLKAQYIISGDMLCSVIGPSGNHIILVGDNTGHGLPAAIGSLIIYDTFYSMVRKGFELESIVEEMNHKLHRLLPSDRFFAASLVEIDPSYEMARVWNGGMPDVLITKSDGSLQTRVPSMNMPLGIRPLNESDIKPLSFDINESSRIYVFSDGITEIFNRDGEVYGEARVLQSLKLNDADKRFDNVLKQAENFRAEQEQTDDILFVEINCDKSLVKLNKQAEAVQDDINPMHWNIKLDLSTEMLRYANPIPVLIQAVVDLQGLSNHREKLFLILTEMYSNAIEHSILGLNSAVKQQPNGFKTYYKERESRLEALSDANLTLDISNYVEGAKGVISMTIEDSGDGFDFEKIETNLLESTNSSGRGLALLKNMCRKFEYSKNGKMLNVEFEWDNETRL